MSCWNGVDGGGGGGDEDVYSSCGTVWFETFVMLDKWCKTGERGSRGGGGVRRSARSSLGSEELRALPLGNSVSATAQRCDRSSLMHRCIGDSPTAASL